MSAHTQERRGHGFAFGLLTGMFVGAGLALWLAPRTISEVRERLTESARSLAPQRSERYEQAGRRLGEEVGDFTRKGQYLRDEVADSIVEIVR